MSLASTTRHLPQLPARVQPSLCCGSQPSIQTRHCVTVIPTPCSEPHFPARLRLQPPPTPSHTRDSHVCLCAPPKGCRVLAFYSHADCRMLQPYVGRGASAAEAARRGCARGGKDGVALRSRRFMRQKWVVFLSAPCAIQLFLPPAARNECRGSHHPRKISHFVSSPPRRHCVAALSGGRSFIRRFYICSRGRCRHQLAGLPRFSAQQPCLPFQLKPG